MDDAQCGVAVLYRIGHDAKRNQVVDLVEIDLLTLELLVDAEKTLDPAVNHDHRNLRVGELRRNRFLQLLDHPYVGPATAFNPRAQGFVH